MYAFPGAYEGPAGGKKKRRRRGGAGRRGGGGGGKSAANQIKRILESANGDYGRVKHEVEDFLRQQRGGRLDMAVDALRELITTVVRSGAVEAAELLVKAYCGGPEGDTPFTPVDAMRELRAQSKPPLPPPPGGEGHP